MTMTAARTRLWLLLPLLPRLVKGQCTSSTLLNPPESSRSYSTIWANEAIGTGHARSMLNSVQAWSATNNVNQHMTIDAGTVYMIHGIATQGRLDDGDQWVKSYSVQVSADGSTFTDVDGGASFTGNSDRNTVVIACPSSAVPARYVRLKPKTWNGHVSMRAALHVSATPPPSPP